MWPQVFLLIQEHQLATAYRITYAFYELGQALATLIVGVIVDKSGYLLVELFFASVLSTDFAVVNSPVHCGHNLRRPESKHVREEEEKDDKTEGAGREECSSTTQRGTCH